MTQRIAIIGGGPGGLMLARLLQRRGLQAIVLERDRHAEERPQGGSLDLHDATGQQAMRAAGLEDAFSASARPEDQGDRLYDVAGTLLFDRDGRGDNRPEIDRSALRRLLLDSLVPESVRWDSRVEAVTASGEVCVNGHSERFDIVVGADGGWSRVRPLLSEAHPVYEGVTLIELGFDAHRHPQVDRLVGGGKMFAVGDNRALVAQRNGHGHIRGYAGWRIAETEARALNDLAPDALRALTRSHFAGWAPSLVDLIDTGDLLAIRPMYALPIGYRWTTRPGITLLGDAAHLMSPFSGEGVNLALADALDLAEALGSGEDWAAVSRCEQAIAARAAVAAEGAAQGLDAAFSPHGVDAVLAHYRERSAA